jgi:nucleoside-diphosphate-sugar epimerase
MRVFITGATGFIGSHVVKELIAGQHEVLGLTRSEASAQALEAMGATAHRGDLEDIKSLKSGADAADAVIHLGFNHDFSNFPANFDIDKKAIEALGFALAGSERPLIVAGGTAGLAGPGETATEENDAIFNPSFPRVSEQTALALVPQGVRASVMRLPQVHNTQKQGIVTFLIESARKNGVSAYVGEGTNRWSAAHISDVARLYRLALEKNEVGARYHAVGEEGVSLKDIAEAIGRGLNIPVKSISPEEAPALLGVWGPFAGQDFLASSAITQEKLGWQPTGPGMIADLDQMQY